MRRIEGTTLGGFKCDEPGCDQNGAYTPMFVVPWKDLPEQIKEPIDTFVDVHCCMTHLRRQNPDKLFSKTLRKGIAGFAEERKGEADFTRARVVPYRTQSPRYLAFQQHAGLVPKDDALVKEAIASPI